MVETGDIVLSKRGRDKGLAMVVVKVENNLAYLADGRNRKVTALKKKNVKHLESVKGAVLRDIATKIKNGESVGNERLYRLIKTQLKNKQED